MTEKDFAKLLVERLQFEANTYDEWSFNEAVRARKFQEDNHPNKDIIAIYKAASRDHDCKAQAMREAIKVVDRLLDEIANGSEALRQLRIAALQQLRTSAEENADED